jgi:hypothetical protein
MPTALLLTPDGERRILVWETASQAYTAIRAALDDGYLEEIRLAPDLVAYADEDGKMKRLPRNDRATVLVHEMFPNRMWADDMLVGPVVITGDDGSPDIVGLSPAWMKRLGLPG